MLKFLTHKLRTHSLNEENVSEKVEERDSGTESDDEAERGARGESDADVTMKWNDVTDISMSESGAATPTLLATPEQDLLYDHHSSEEELEVINGAPAPGGTRRRGASSPPRTAPEKRKWPAHYDDELATRAPSSDDDDTKVETPVRFRTSPPLEALKPRRGTSFSGLSAASGAGGSGCGCSVRAGGSPRRRRAPPPPPLARRHRPALDFDKMQQLKVAGGGVRSWRGVGGAGGELSVFCW